MAKARIKMRGDTAARWTSENPILLTREWGFETDSFTLSGGVRHYKFKIGDGVTEWVDLPYARLAAVGGGGGATAFIELTDVPASYVGMAGKILKVTEAEDGVEFEVIEAADLPTGIDAAKIGDGSISNTEFQFLNNVSSNIQSQMDGKQASLGYTAETQANKATDFSTVNDTKYPTVEAVQEYVASAISGLYDDRGNYDASVNTFPASGGSGTAGAVLKGDIWTVSVAGTLGGSAVEIGDLVRALVDTPGQTASNWAITQNNIQYVPENQANKENSTLDTSTTKYPTNRLVKEQVDLKAPIASPTLTGTLTTPAIIVSSETASRIAIFDSSKNVKSADTATYPSLTELAFVKGLSSAVQTQLDSKAADSAVVHDTGDETIAGVKTFSSDPIIPDEVYGAGWNGSLEPPTKNAVYDKIETISAGGLTNWTESFNGGTQNTSSFSATNAGSNVNAAVVPKGTGAFCLAIPDGTSTGGNAR